MGDRLSAVLFVLVLGLAGVVAAQWRLGPATHAPITPRIVTDTDAIAPPVTSPAALPALVDLTETVDRPVFSPVRRPPQAPTAPAQEVAMPTQSADAPPPSVKLSAVVIEQQRRFALLQRLSAAGTVRVEQGDSVDGWTLSEVRPDGVTLEKEDRRHEIALRTFEPAPAPAATAPQRPGQGELPRQAAPIQRPGQAAPAQRIVPRQLPRRPLRGPRRQAPARGPAG